MEEIKPWYIYIYIATCKKRGHREYDKLALIWTNMPRSLPLCYFLFLVFLVLWPVGGDSKTYHTKLITNLCWPTARDLHFLLHPSTPHYSLCISGQPSRKKLKRSHTNLLFFVLVHGIPRGVIHVDFFFIFFFFFNFSYKIK